MDNVLKADNILTPAAEVPGIGRNSLQSPPSALNTDPASQSQADTFDTIPPTPQAQRPPTLPYQIINSLTSTIGGMANSASAMPQQQGREAASPTSSYFPDAPHSNESSSSGELGNAGQAAKNHGVENRKRGYSGSRANRSLSNASVGSGGVSLGLSLTNSTLFYDIPMSDALSDLIEKHISPEKRPRRESVELSDVEKLKTADALQELVNRKSWRSVARFTRNRIVQTNPSHLAEILQLWYVRLQALVNLRLYQLALAELDKLGDLNRQEYTFEYHQGLFPGKSGIMIPFELRVLSANLPGLMKHYNASIERLTILAMECQRLNSKEDTELWRKREVSLYIMLANFLLEIKDFPLTISIMTKIVNTFSNGAAEPDVISTLGRLYLQLGNIQDAKKVFKGLESQEASDPHVKRLVRMNSALCHVAAADWSPAKEELDAILAEDPNDYEAVNNLVVCLIYLGELNQAIAVMEDLISKSNDQAHGLIEKAVFNLCTLYELRSDTAMEKKIWKLQQLHPYLGDGFHVESFKI
ncbi:hypothetical protein K450DRAFT_248065 [Umbelopsis ramanniana AG]|uniref:Trafficking protein particle complex subunit 12 n=1 Tax=Umbelopsis ramanniana AG TaxID=1314678 RepID=A0AAD5E6A7_UMBRA|nr:uncharacterized protein K450DRAFT_248065 [Umbelopsis ramanniana AG]KAI8578278.1 hypothetical protein K450DRAFT_248065 [Umbelopsis ramanniana AG]